jgi:hypothetical protein
MIRTVLVFSVAAALGCAVATAAAAFMYLVILLDEPVALHTAVASAAIGVDLSRRGVLLAVPAAVLLSFLTGHLHRVLFIAIACTVAAALGVVLSFWSFHPQFHVSRECAAVLLALTWSSAGLVLGTIAHSSPN